jgi:hypothetical protein
VICTVADLLIAEPDKVGKRVAEQSKAAVGASSAAVLAAATTPVARLAVALAARPKAIRLMRLDDVDLGNRRLVIDGKVRRLDDLTHQLLTEWP